MREHKGLHIYVEPRVKNELLTESDYYNFVQTWKRGECERLLLYYRLITSKLIILSSYCICHCLQCSFNQGWPWLHIELWFSWQPFMVYATNYLVASLCTQSTPLFYLLADDEIMLLHTKVDLVVTLGGDGTVLWVCQTISFSWVSFYCSRHYNCHCYCSTFKHVYLLSLLGHSWNKSCSRKAMYTVYTKYQVYLQSINCMLSLAIFVKYKNCYRLT